MDLERGASLILGVAAIYLVALGTIAVVLPDKARRFLAAFGQSRGANNLEALIRGIVGGAMIVASSGLGFPVGWVVAGIILIVSALWMIAFPLAHKRIADRSVKAVAPHVRVLGISSICLGVGLIAIVVR